VKVRLVPRAQADIDKAITWWRRNAERPLMLEQALQVALEKLRINPSGLPAGSQRVPDVQRISLATRHLVFFRVDDVAQEVVVLRVWHMSRGRPPKL
jgi:plasmid stabilization system protein ParE